VATEYNKVGAGAATLQNTYVQGLGIDQKHLRIAQDGTRRHFVGDLIGTVGMTVDDTGGTIDTSVKDAWGVQIAGATLERFGGLAQREIDTESGLTYVRHRMYDPKLGRFTQGDPILGNRPPEHYAYATNNPVQHKDPTGLDIFIQKGDQKEFETLLSDSGITGFKSSDLQAFGLSYGGAADNLGHPKDGLQSEILWRMLISSRSFHFKSMAELKNTIKVRTQIVESANAVKFSIGDQYPDNWRTQTIFEGKVDAAVGSWFGEKGAAFKTGCLPAILLCFLNGVGQTMGVDVLNKIGAEVRDPVRGTASINNIARRLTDENPSNKDTDWIPGDWGYIKNNVDKPKAFQEGENILYLGGSFSTGDAFKTEKNFWGLRSEGGFKDSLNDWQKRVSSWDKVESTITDRRTTIKGEVLRPK
jgi:RHS repeat-associated protein